MVSGDRRSGLAVAIAWAVVLVGVVGPAGAQPAEIVKLPKVSLPPPALPLPEIAQPLVPVQEVAPVPLPDTGALQSPVTPPPTGPVQAPSGLAAPSVPADPSATPAQPPATRAAPGSPAAPPPSIDAPRSAATPRSAAPRRPGDAPALTPAQRRRVLDTPLRKTRLRRLRQTIVEHQGCLDGLTDRGRRALVLRAGLFGSRPASRRAIARRLGISPVRALRLERSSLRGLTRAGARGLCDSGAAVVGAATARGADLLAGGGSAAPLAGTSSGDRAGAPAGERAAGDGDPEPAGDVLGDTRQGSGLELDLEDGLDAAPEALPLLVLLLAGSLAAALLAARRLIDERAALAAASAERPLLFLDVDGVIALDPWIADLPPDLRYLRSLGASYVPDRAGKLVCKLADRFDVVWATGWEQEANTRVRDVLGLEDELPVLRFGKKAVHGSAEWKIERVDRYARHRPAAWIDDNLCDDHEDWAERRPEPTLLVPADPHVGIRPEDVERLIDWADGLAPSEVGSRNGG